MTIKLNLKKSVYIESYSDMGLQILDPLDGRIFEVIDKQLFFLAAIKYGLDYEEITIKEAKDILDEVTYLRNIQF
jgi:hypothetical protein